MSDQPPTPREPLFNAPWPALVLVATIFAAFGLQVMTGGGESPLLQLGFAPVDLWQGRAWTLVTYQYLHGGLVHVTMNGIWALIFAVPVSRLLGADRIGAGVLLLFYLACGVVAALGFALLHLHADGAPLIGASGAVAGLMGAGSRLIHGHAYSPAPLTDRLVVAMAIGFNLLFIVVGAAGLTPGAGLATVAWEAHVAGYLFGLLTIGPVWRASLNLRRSITSWRRRR